MSYLSFENNIIEASGSLILKSKTGEIDCSNATLKNVTIDGSERITVTSISASNEDISFNGSNLMDISSIQVNYDISCASLNVYTIGFENHDISFNGSNLVDVSYIQVNNDVSCASLFVNTIGFENHDISFNGSNLMDISSIQVNYDISCASLNVSTIGFENHYISFNGSNLLDISSIQVNNDVSCASLNVSTIGFENHDISFNGSNLLDISSIQVNNDVSCASLRVDTIGFANHDISFNGSNLLDVSSIQVNNDVSCASLFVNTISSNNDRIFINKDVIIDGSLSIQTGELTLIKTKDLDISDNIIGLNRGNISGNDKNTSGMLINYADTSNVFFGYHNGENAFVIADTSYNHDDVGRDIVVDKYVDLKVGNTTIYNDSSDAILEVRVKNDYSLFKATDNLNSEIRVFGSVLGHSKIVWGEKNDLYDITNTDNIISESQYGGCIYYDGNTDNPKTEFRRITTSNQKANNLDDNSDVEDISENTVFEYSHNSNDVTFYGDISCAGIITCKNITTTENIALNQASFDEITVDKLFCNNDACFNDISVNTIQANSAIITENDPVFTVSTNDFSVGNNNSHISNIKIIGNNNNNSNNGLTDAHGITRYYNVGGANLFLGEQTLGEQTEYGSGIRYFSQPFIYHGSSPDGFDNYKFDNPGTTVFYRKPNDAKEYPVFYYNYDSDDVTFNGNIEISGNLTVKEISIDACFNLIGNDPVFTVSTNDFSNNNPHISNIKIIGNNETFNSNSDRYHNVGGANLFLGEQTDCGSGIRYFSQPFIYNSKDSNNSSDGFDNYIFDNSGTTVFYRKKNDEENKLKEYPVFYYNYDSDDVTFNGNIEISGNLNDIVRIDTSLNTFDVNGVYKNNNIFEVKTRNINSCDTSTIRIIGGNSQKVDANEIIMGQACLFLGERTAIEQDGPIQDYGGGIRYFCNPLGTQFKDIRLGNYDTISSGGQGITSFYRTTENVEYPVFYFTHNNDTVYFNGDINVNGNLNDIARIDSYLNTFNLSSSLSVSKYNNIFEIKTRDENSCDTSTIRIIGGKSNVFDSTTDKIIMGQACLFLGERTAIEQDGPIQDYGGGIRYFCDSRGTNNEFADGRLEKYNQISVPSGHGGITSFYRTTQNVEFPVFYFTHLFDTVYFNGDINIKDDSRLITNSISSTTTYINFNNKNLTHIGNISSDNVADIPTIELMGINGFDEQGANIFLGHKEEGLKVGGGIHYFANSQGQGSVVNYQSFVNKDIIVERMTSFYRTSGSSNTILFYFLYNDNDVTFIGQVNATSFNATSDYRTKTNIEELDENITVTNLRPLVYLKNGQKEIGLIAHELQEVYPFMVHGEKDGKKMQSVNYNNLIGVLINDVKRLTKENDTLKSDYNTLKSRLDILEEKFIKKFE